jgi:hypothetical protein
MIVPVLNLADDGQPGWDQLSDLLSLGFGMVVVAGAFFTVSFGAGVHAVRHRKMALFWVVPIGLGLLTCAGLLVARWVAPYWNASWF